MEEDDWKYCDEDDRRFYQEQLFGMNPGSRSREINSGKARSIPRGAYDVGNGYYDPEAKAVFNYEGAQTRVPDDKEREWIQRTCRVGH